MGYFEGLLGGFTGRQREVQTEELRAAELANAREGRLFEALLASPDAEIRSMAATGLLESARPVKRKGGLRGWLGEMESNPLLPRMRTLLDTPVETTETLREPTTHAGYVPEPPPAVGGASMPTGNAVEAGQPASALITGVQPSPTVEPPVAPITPDVRAGGPGQGAVLGQRTTSRPREAFRSREDQIRADKVAGAQGDIEGEVAGLVASGFSEEEARSLIQQNYLRRTLAGSAAAQTYAEGNLVEDVNHPGTWYQELYLRANPAITHRIPAQPPGYMTRSGGIDRETISREPRFGGMAFARQSPEGVAAVDAEVRRRAVQQAGNTAYSRTAATEQAQFNAPIDAPTAQRLGLPVGPPSAVYAGQAVPTLTQQDRRRTLTDVKDQLHEVRTNLLKVLPAEKELAGLLPGLTNNLRAAYFARVPAAELETAVNAVLSTLDRAVNEARGTQTEQDARRAYSLMVNVQRNWLNIIQGDTQETAAARITQTLGVIDRILTRLPATPVPQAGTGRGGPQVGTPPPSTTAAPSASATTPDLSTLPAGRVANFQRGPFAGQRWRNGPNGPERLP